MSIPSINLCLCYAWEKCQFSEMVMSQSCSWVRVWNKIPQSQKVLWQNAHAHTRYASTFLLAMTTVLLSLAGCREAFTPPTGPGAGVWDHLESTICFSTDPTHCLACTICHRNSPPHHGHHHKPIWELPYPCVTFVFRSTFPPSPLAHVLHIPINDCYPTMLPISVSLHMPLF